MNRTSATLLRCSASVLVLAGAMSPLAPAFAQDSSATGSVPAGVTADGSAGAPNVSAATSPAATDATDQAAQNPAEGDIVVTGTRAALQTSQNIKRNADTFVDSITATDIGSFPDKSVADALQRVPGITVSRFAASDDTSHVTAEPSGVLVRGLTQVRSEYNGRDTFSANSSRGLSWEDISADLMAGVDTYKNQTAEMIEGGIAGVINLRTRLPFDSKDQVISATLNLNYGDRNKKFTPDISAIYSNRWETEAGDFGIMANLAYAKLSTASENIAYGRTAVFKDVYGPGMQYIPSSVGFRETLTDRTRKGGALAAQWQSPDGSMLATAQYNRSQYKEVWHEHAVISYLTDLYAFPTDFVFTNGGANAPRIPKAAPGTEPFTFDSDGNFETGVLVNQQTDFSWWGASDAEAGTIALNDQGQNMLEPCYSWGPGDPAACPDARGPDLNAVTRYNETKRMTQDASLNLKWDVTDRLHLNLDGQFVDATLKNYDVEVGQYSFANVAIDASNGKPTMEFLDPTNINQSVGGLSNPNNYRYNHAMDHLEDSDGQEWAFRGDLTYDLESDWLGSIKVGARYADRDQTVRYSAYNWGGISQNWNLNNGQAAYWNIDSYTPSGSFNGYKKGLTEVRSFGNSFFGGRDNFVFFNMDELANRGVSALGYDALGAGVQQWEPICSNGGTSNQSGRVGEIEGSCFRPDEINRISETTKAAYAMLKFGGPNATIGGLGISGNIGLRYVETKDKVSGSTVFPNQISASSYPCQRNVTEAGQPAPALPYSTGCYLFGNAALLATPTPDGFTDFALAGSPDVIAFSSGTAVAGNSVTTHRNWLPSFNIRIDLSPTWLVRFAASRALSRPDVGLLKNYTTFGTTLPGNDPSDPRYIKDSSGRVTGLRATYTGSGYNPRLKPMTATMFDLSLEHYFAAVGQLAVTGFYKKFKDYIQYGSEFVDYTNNGVTESIEVRGPFNGKGGKVYGAEGSFQRFFDFLPGALSGFGVQANATYIKNKGIENSGVKNQNGTDGGGQAQAGSAGTVLAVGSLEGLSKYSYNLVGMYEKYGLALRVAYNWRSKYLVTAVDCCTYLPMWLNSSGYVDASVRYAIAPAAEISFQVQNLTNTTSRLRQQVTSADEGAILTPAGWSAKDRRFIVGTRIKF